MRTTPILALASLTLLAACDAPPLSPVVPDGPALAQQEPSPPPQEQVSGGFLGSGTRGPTGATGGTGGGGDNGGCGGTCNAGGNDPKPGNPKN